MWPDFHPCIADQIESKLAMHKENRAKARARNENLFVACFVQKGHRKVQNNNSKRIEGLRIYEVESDLQYNQTSENGP